MLLDSLDQSGFITESELQLAQIFFFLIDEFGETVDFLIEDSHLNFRLGMYLVLCETVCAVVHLKLVVGLLERLVLFSELLDDSVQLLELS